MKVEQAKKNEMVEFLKSTPCCHKLPKSILNRLYYGVEKKALTRSQNLISEGDSSQYIYFIKEGSFEMTKKITLTDHVQNEKNMDNEVIRNLLFNKNQNQANMHLRMAMSKFCCKSNFYLDRNKKKHLNAKLALVGPGKTV